MAFGVPGTKTIITNSLHQAPWNLDLIITGVYQQTTATSRGKEPFFLYVANNVIHTPILTSPYFVYSSGGGPYGDFIQELDFSLGEILKALDKCGLSENTLVLFTSDNGGHPYGANEAIHAGLKINGILLFCAMHDPFLEFYIKKTGLYFR